MSSDILDELVGGSVVCKAEGLQRTGSFKLRGAWNAVAALDPAQRERGVITYSSGNHGRAVAFAARSHGARAVVVLPLGASESKRAAIARLGAEIVEYDPASTDRAGLAHEIAGARGLALVAPYDDLNVVAGQGTVARELLQEWPDLDTLLVPLGGGGLLAGCALACAEGKDVEVIGVESAAVPKTQVSLAAGERISVVPAVTISDAQRATEPGAVTFPILQSYGVQVLTAKDDDLRQAMVFAFDELGLVCEPTAVAALAAVLTGVVSCEGRRVGLVLTGSNIDASSFAMLTGTMPRRTDS